MRRKAIIVLTISATMIALASFVPWKQFISYGAIHRYHIIQIAPTTFTETKSSGFPVVHQILQAKIQTAIKLDTADLEIYARNLFDSNLKRMADSQHIEMVWITFYLADNPEQLSGMVNTFRDIYVREDGNWHRFQPPVGQRI